jgi:hypothetical protein
MIHKPEATAPKQIPSRHMSYAEMPDSWKKYYQAKAREIPRPKADPVSDLINVLDTATVMMLNHGGSVYAVDEAFEAVLTHPDSTWTRDVLNYRQLQVHYK